MKKIISLVLFLLPTLAICQFTPGQKKELDKKIYKTQLFLKKQISNDLSMMLSQEGIMVSVEIKVDEKKIFDEVGGLDDKWDQVKTMQLPGLFLESGTQEPLKEVRGINEENILANITDMSVSINLTYDGIDNSQVRELVREIIAANYSRIEAIQLDVTVDYKEPLITSDNKSFTYKIKNALPYIIAAGVFLFAIVMLFLHILRGLKGSMDALNGVIASKDFSGNLSIKADSLAPKEEQKSKALAKRSNGPDAIDKYYQLVEKIKLVLSSNYEVVSQMITFNFHLEEYEKVMVLMEAIPSDKRDLVYQKVSDKNVKKFKDFLVYNGDDLYDSGESLLLSAKHITKMISLSAINPENFYSYYLKQICGALTTAQIAMVINKLTINEFMFFIEFVDKASLSFAMASSGFDSMKLSADYKALSEDDIRLCVDKISKLVVENDSSLTDDPREAILPYLTSEMEEVVLSKLNLPKEHSFNFIVSNNIQKVASYLKELEYEQMVLTLSNFSESLRDSFISEMPDILAERLLKETYTLSKDSLVYKSRLSQFLTIEIKQVGASI
ncbi:MAG: hypothetical protein N4A33_01220 [Bacteriovoracaceae bacterium]|jgi:hypothetical protein|nr:hypothetical protein [Bacteriovoracaceae bacterium]